MTCVIVEEVVDLTVEIDEEEEKRLAAIEAEEKAAKQASVRYNYVISTLEVAAHSLPKISYLLIIS